MSEYLESEGAESGGPLAWRVFVTLEGAALLLAALGLIARAARPRTTTCTKHARKGEAERAPHVLVSNIITDKERSVVEKLAASGCRVSSLTEASSVVDRADALVVFGARPTSKSGLDGLAAIVSDDVFVNMKVMEKARDYVRPGGCLVWVSGGAISGSFEASAAAFEDVLRAQLQQIADDAKCEAVWIVRGDPMLQVTDILVAILTSMNRNRSQSFDIVSTITKITLVLWRWLKSLS